MSSFPSESELRKRLKSTVGRPHKYEQGEVVYGVREFNNNPPIGTKWASGGQLFRDEDYMSESAKSRAESYFYDEQPLRNPEIHDTVLYKGRVAVPDSRGGRDSAVVSPAEETEIILTDIKILDRRKPGYQP